MLELCILCFYYSPCIIYFLEGGVTVGCSSPSSLPLLSSCRVSQKRSAKSFILHTLIGKWHKAFAHSILFPRCFVLFRVPVKEKIYYILLVFQISSRQVFFCGGQRGIKRTSIPFTMFRHDKPLTAEQTRKMRKIMPPEFNVLWGIERKEIPPEFNVL